MVKSMNKILIALAAVLLVGNVYGQLAPATVEESLAPEAVDEIISAENETIPDTIDATNATISNVTELTPDEAFADLTDEELLYATQDVSKIIPTVETFYEKPSFCTQDYQSIYMALDTFNLTYFKALVDIANLTTTLANPASGELTIFAPSNTAMGLYLARKELNLTIAYKEFSDQNEREQQLQTVLYHMTLGYNPDNGAKSDTQVNFDELQFNKRLPTLLDIMNSGTVPTELAYYNGYCGAHTSYATIGVEETTTLPQLVGGTVTSDAATFVAGQVDIETCNGVMHIIDQVLEPCDIPLTVASEACSSYEEIVNGVSVSDSPEDPKLPEAAVFGTLFSQVEDEDIDFTMKDVAYRATVFAPSKDAIQSFLKVAKNDNLPASSTDACYQEFLREVLMYHVSYEPYGIEKLFTSGTGTGVNQQLISSGEETEVQSLLAKYEDLMQFCGSNKPQFEIIIDESAAVVKVKDATGDTATIINQYQACSGYVYLIDKVLQPCTDFIMPTKPNCTNSASIGDKLLVLDQDAYDGIPDSSGHMLSQTLLLGLVGAILSLALMA